MLKINEYFYHLQGRDMFVHKNHSHNEIEFIQVISGNGLVLKNDRTYVLQSQELFVIDARKAHIVYPQPEDCFDYVRNKIVIDADSFLDFCKIMGMEEVVQKLFESGPVSTVDNARYDSIYKTVSELCNSGCPENIAFAQGYVAELLHMLYQNLSSGKSNTMNVTFQKILDVINEKEGLTSLSEISQILHMDKYYLCRLFRQQTGAKLSDYLAEKVFEKCRKLLDNSDLSLEEIALQCGFSSQASLSRFFKNKSGTTPSNYRKSSKSKITLVF